MNRLIQALALVVLTAGAFAAEWQDELSDPAPGSFAPLRPLHAEYKFGWTAFSAATANFDFTKAKPGQMRMDVDAKTTGFVRTLWKMDAKHSAIMQSSTLHPVSVRQTEVYKDKTIKTKLDFSQNRRRPSSGTNPSGTKAAKAEKVRFS